jgi:hypothetical protein
LEQTTDAIDRTNDAAGPPLLLAIDYDAGIARPNDIVAWGAFALRLMGLYVLFNTILAIANFMEFVKIWIKYPGGGWGDLLNSNGVSTAASLVVGGSLTRYALPLSIRFFGNLPLISTSRPSANAWPIVVRLLGLYFFVLYFTTIVQPIRYAASWRHRAFDPDNPSGTFFWSSFVFLWFYTSPLVFGMALVIGGRPIARWLASGDLPPPPHQADSTGTVN